MPWLNSPLAVSNLVVLAYCSMVKREKLNHLMHSTVMNEVEWIKDAAFDPWAPVRLGTRDAVKVKTFLFTRPGMLSTSVRQLIRTNNEPRSPGQLR